MSTIQGGELKAGMYLYSLIADGQVVSGTKENDFDRLNYVSMMKRLQMIYLLTFISSILFTQCGNDVDPEIQDMNFIGNEVMIGYDETVLLQDSVAGKVFEVVFTGEIKDRRCPKSSCALCYFDIAFIDFYWKEENSADSAKLTVDIGGCLEQCSKLDTLGYSFCLTGLEPYPWEDSISPNEYIAKIKIERL